MSDALLLALLAGTPLLFAVCGELVVQKSGTINIALEGGMLAAAFGAAAGGHATGSILGGVAGALAGALAVNLLFGAVTLHLGGDQIVTGVSINLVALGATSMLYRSTPALAGGLPSLPRFGALGLDPLLVTAWTLAPLATALLLWRSRAGLRIRAAGEAPEAIAAGGRSGRTYRWMALAFESVAAGLGGAYLALALSHGFAENMTAGRGFIALAIVIFARWRVLGALAGCLLFAGATAAQYALQARGAQVPFHLLLSVPYVATLAILLAAPSSLAAPAALGRADESTS